MTTNTKIGALNFFLKLKFIFNVLTLPGNSSKKPLPKRPYKLWTEKSKQELDKVFKDYIKADYGYPSKCELYVNAT